MIVEVTSLIGVGLIAAGVYSSAKKPKMTAAQVEAATAAAHSRWQGKAGEAAPQAAPPLRRSRRGLVLGAVGVLTLAAGFLLDGPVSRVIGGQLDRYKVAPAASVAFGPDLPALMAQNEHKRRYNTPRPGRAYWSGEGQVSYSIYKPLTNQTFQATPDSPKWAKKMLVYFVTMNPDFPTREGGKYCYRANVSASYRVLNSQHRMVNGEKAETTVPRCFAQPLQK